MAKKPIEDDKIIGIQTLALGVLKCRLLGTSPLVMNRMAKKAREHLLLPPRRVNRAGREAVQKHNPPAEFNDSIYRCRDSSAPTLVHIPNGAFKKAMAQAAIDIAGATKAEIGRLVQVIDPIVHVYGIPYLYMDTVRQAGISRTPDIRTRAMFKTWAVELTIRYVRSNIREQDIANLIANAGILVGVGDGRVEKGTFANGQWAVVRNDDKDWLGIVANGGRAAQIAAMDQPQCCDLDTEEMLAWYETEIIRRESNRKTTSAPEAVVTAAKVIAKRRRNGGKSLEGAL
jgi:hypothetical protein